MIRELGGRGKQNHSRPPGGKAHMCAKAGLVVQGVIMKAYPVRKARSEGRGRAGTSMRVGELPNMRVAPVSTTRFVHACRYEAPALFMFTSKGVGRTRGAEERRGDPRQLWTAVARRVLQIAPDTSAFDSNESMRELKAKSAGAFRASRQFKPGRLLWHAWSRQSNSRGRRQNTAVLAHLHHIRTQSRPYGGPTRGHVVTFWGRNVDRS